MNPEAFHSYDSANMGSTLLARRAAGRTIQSVKLISGPNRLVLHNLGELTPAAASAAPERWSTTKRFRNHVVRKACAPVPNHPQHR